MSSKWGLLLIGELYQSKMEATNFFLPIYVNNVANEKVELKFVHPFYKKKKKKSILLLGVYIIEVIERFHDKYLLT